MGRGPAILAGDYRRIHFGVPGIAGHDTRGLGEAMVPGDDAPLLPHFRN